MQGPGQQVQTPEEDESYTLTVTPQGAVLKAPTVVGALRGFETIIQLLAQQSSGFYLPAVSIADAPRFPWRGLLVDACRHWQPVEVIKRTLDGMAAVKLNVLHWHLSEDQGFRVESKKFPGSRSWARTGTTTPRKRSSMWSRTRGRVAFA